MTENTLSSFESLLRGREVVVDTSTLLLAGTNIFPALPACTLVIPAIVVKELEEKRSHTTVGFLAREWIRFLEDLRVGFGERMRSGVPVPHFKEITLKVEPNHSNQASLPKHLQDGSHDSTILAVAANLRDEEGGNGVVLMSNDAPMRLHATLDLKLPAVEFNATRVLSAEPFSGRYLITLTEEEYLSSDKIGSGTIPFEDVVASKLPQDVASHALVQVELENSEELLSQLLYNEGRLEAVHRKARALNVTPRTIEQDVAVEYLRAPAEELPLVSLGGSAGTGKTLLSVAVGLEELSKGSYQKLVVFRSLHEMGQGQELGFLPGTLDEKMEVWAGAVYDAIDFLAGAKKETEAKKAEVKRMREMIEVSPITYLRGRSLSNSFIILDEAQNFSRNEILNILSRAGEGTKMVLCFDSAQVDNKYLQAGSKAEVWSVIESLKKEDIFAHVTLARTERSRVAALTSRLLAG